MNYIINLDLKSIKTYYLDAIKEYEKRLSRYCRIKKADLSDAEINAKSGYKVLICPDGDSISSTGLAETISRLSVNSVSDIFLNLKPSHMDIYDSRICVSRMQMDQGLLAVVVFEQLYRGYRIINNEPYHK